MFYGQCWKCGERWGLGTASTCKCPDETPKREWVELTDEEVITMSRYDLEYAALIGEVQRRLKEKNT